MIIGCPRNLDTRQITYRYDAAGRRVARLVDGAVVERYLWADSTRLLATYDASGTLTRRFLYADARVPYALDTPSGRYFMAYDQAGSLRVVTDATGAVVERHETDSFGVPLSAEPTSSITGLGFAGGLADPDTGLSLFGARDYDAGAGRWMAKDPIGFGGGDVNLYGYCLADPVNLVDPSGLMNATSDGGGSLGTACLSDGYIVDYRTTLALTRPGPEGYALWAPSLMLKGIGVLTTPEEGAGLVMIGLGYVYDAGVLVGYTLPRYQQQQATLGDVLVGVGSFYPPIDYASKTAILLLDIRDPRPGTGPFVN